MKAHCNHKEPPHGMPGKPPAFRHSRAMVFACPSSPQLEVFYCQQPWPRSLAQRCFGKLSLQPSWFWVQPGNVLARRCSAQKGAWNYALLCKMQKSYKGKGEWLDPSTCHFFPPEPRHSLLLWRDGSNFGAPLCGVAWKAGELPESLVLWGNYRKRGTNHSMRHIFSHIFF